MIGKCVALFILLQDMRLFIWPASYRVVDANSGSTPTPTSRYKLMYFHFSAGYSSSRVDAKKKLAQMHKHKCSTSKMFSLEVPSSRWRRMAATESSKATASSTSRLPDVATTSPNSLSQQEQGNETKQGASSS